MKSIQSYIEEEIAHAALSSRLTYHQWSLVDTDFRNARWFAMCHGVGTVVDARFDSGRPGQGLEVQRYIKLEIKLELDDTIEYPKRVYVVFAEKQFDLEHLSKGAQIQFEGRIESEWHESKFIVVDKSLLVQPPPTVEEQKEPVVEQKESIKESSTDSTGCTIVPIVGLFVLAFSLIVWGYSFGEGVKEKHDDYRNYYENDEVIRHLVGTRVTPCSQCEIDPSWIGYQVLRANRTSESFGELLCQ